MKNLKELVGGYFLDTKNKREPISLHSLFKMVAKEYNLEISKSIDPKKGYDIKGNNGYEIILDVIFLLIKMEQKSIISFYKQGNPSSEFEAIQYYNGDNINSSILSVDLANYIDEHMNCAIYVSSDILDFINNGFVTPELIEAKKQTKAAKCTLWIAIATFVLTALCTDGCGCFVEYLVKLFCKS